MVRVVIIDDEPLVCDTIADVLKQGGYEVDIAHNGARGIELAQESQVSAVVADVVMPNMDGLEVIQELRKVNQAVKIIAMSGGGRHGNFDYLKSAARLGADKVLYKPFNTEELLDALEECLSE